VLWCTLANLIPTGWGRRILSSRPAWATQWDPASNKQKNSPEFLKVTLFQSFRIFNHTVSWIMGYLSPLP
jgi:hypothetical protein